MSKKYCGSSLWVDYSPATEGISLKEKLYRYDGVIFWNKLMYHKFLPVVKSRAKFMLTDHQIMMNLSVFKPFILDMVYLKEQNHPSLGDY